MTRGHRLGLGLFDNKVDQHRRRTAPRRGRSHHRAGGAADREPDSREGGRGVPGRGPGGRRDEPGRPRRVPKLRPEDLRGAGELPDILRGREGRVFTFETREDLEQVREYYEEFADFFPSYVHVEGNVLVQIPDSVPEEQAEQYGEVLRKA